VPGLIKNNSIKIPNFKGVLLYDYPLAKHTTWKIGGAAEVFAIPANLDDLLSILLFGKRNGVPVYILGQGSNILIDDEGVPGITLHLGKHFQYQHSDNEFLRVGASVKMPSMAKKAAELGYEGYEFLIGIPGTVGAGIVINAGKGTDGSAEIKNILQSVTYINRDMQFITLNVAELEMKYRSSLLYNNGAIVIEGIFRFSNTQNPKVILSHQKEILKQRQAKFPLNFPNAGSVFKRPENGIAAGKLIELAGLKGYRIGDAQVSSLHANFIVNSGNAKSADVKCLMNIITEKVFQLFAVKLEKEIQFIPEQPTWL
jgi:UDP-N-acetylmuramate dehydrogenase